MIFQRDRMCYAGKGTDAIFPALANSSANVEKFVDSAIKYATSSKVDGIDLDWEVSLGMLKSKDLQCG